MLSTSPALPETQRLDSPVPQPAADKPITARTFLQAFALALLLLAPTLWYPVGRDTANFLYVARVMAHGGTLYRDAWEIKPPGIFLAFSVLTRTCDGAALVPFAHIVDIALCGIVGLLLAQLAGAFGVAEAGWAAAAWYASFYLEGGFGNLAETESWANPAALGATLLCLRVASPQSRHNERILFCAGILAAVAALVKFTMLAPLLPFVVLALWRCRSLRATAWFAGGFAIAFAIAILWLRWSGAWPAYEDIQRHFVVPYVAYSSAPFGPHFAMLLRFVKWYGIVLWMPTLLGVAALGSRGWPAKFKCASLASLALCVLAIWIQQKCIFYYWEALFPVAGLLAAIGSVKSMRLARMPSQWLAPAALLLAMGWHAYRNYPEYILAARHATGGISAAQWWAHFSLPGEDDPVGKAYDAAAYVSAHTNPDDSILVYGFESTIYIVSNRHAPSRFFFNPPVVSNYAPDAWRYEFLHDLEARPPKLILLRHGDSSEWIGGAPGDSCALFLGSEPQRAWLDANYRLAQDDSGFAIYRYARGDHQG